MFTPTVLTDGSRTACTYFLCTYDLGTYQCALSFELTAGIIEAKLVSIFQEYGGSSETDLREQVLPGLCAGIAQGAMVQIEALDIGAAGWQEVEMQLAELVSRYAEQYGLAVTNCNVNASLITAPPKPATDDVKSPTSEGTGSWFSWISW